MDNMSVGLQEELIADLATELKNDEALDLDILKAKVVCAIREVKLMRNYGATSYTDKQIQEDLYNFYSIIKRVALYDYNQIGAEGEKSHNENSVSRTWEDRSKLFNGVHAFVKIL